MLEQKLEQLNQMITETNLALCSIADALNDLVALQCNPMQAKPMYPPGGIETPEEPVLETKEAETPQETIDEEPSEEPAEEAVNETIAEPDTEQVQYTLKDVKEALRQLHLKKGIGAINEMLEKYGYDKISNIDEKDYVAFYTEALK